MRKNKQELINIILEKAKQLNRTPTLRDMKERFIIRKTFNTWNNALEQAGLTLNLKINKQKNKKEATMIILNKKNELGRTPKCKEIKELNYIKSVFGSWGNALNELDLKKSKRIKKIKTKKELINILLETTYKLNRVPKVVDIKESRTIIRRFGSWNNAIYEAGIKNIEF